MNGITITPRLSPCKDCGERKLHCHSNCEKYADYRAGINGDTEQRVKVVAETDFRRSVKHNIAQKQNMRKYNARGKKRGRNR